MTDRLPSMPFFVGDYLASGWVQMLSLEEQGAYVRFLCLQWQEGSLPEFEANLARLLGEDRRKFRRIWAKIGDKFPVTSPGKRQNRRVEEIRNSYLEKKKQASEAGKSGAEARWQPHDSANGESIPPIQSNPDTKKKTPHKPPKGGEVDPGFERFWEAYPRKESKKKAETAYRRANVNGRLQEVISWIEEAKQSRQWQDKAMIPHPSTFLNQRRWEADPPPRGDTAEKGERFPRDTYRVDDSLSEELLAKYGDEYRRKVLEAS